MMTPTHVLNRAGLLMLVLLAVWIYLPGLAGPTVLDDGVNLRVLEKLEQSDEFQRDIVSQNKAGPFGRPVSMASFVIEKRLLGDDHRISKAVNLALHCLVAVLVYLFSTELFRALGYGVRAPTAGLLVAGAWLLAPLFVSTVLYLVQRMAQLATLFSLLALWAYLRWRAGGRSAWLAVLLLAVPLAILSKENALLVLPLLILVELFVLQPRDREEGALSPCSLQLYRLHLGLLGAGILGSLAFLLLQPGWVTHGYSGRDFSLVERLLTESRVLWRYMAQLFWVNSDYLGIYQDAYPLSHGLLRPSTTAWSLLGLAGLLVLTVVSLRSPVFRGLGVGLLLFFVGHSLESTIFPLEIYFEHRNYLPAVGLLIAPVALAFGLWRCATWLGPWLLAAWLVMIGHATLATAREAQLWSNEYLLHLTAVNRHPHSVRAQVEMARVMSQGGFLEVSLDYLRRAQDLESGNTLVYQLREGLLYCRSGIEIPETVFRKWALEPGDIGNDEVTETAYLLIKDLIDGRCSQTDMAALADHWHQLVESAKPQRLAPKFYVALAQLENHIERYEQALAYTEKLLEKYPADSQALLMKLYFVSALQLEGERATTLALLEAQRSEGRLSAQQRYNLDLFTTSETATEP